MMKTPSAGRVNQASDGSSCSSWMSPTISSMMSSRVTIALHAPELVHDEGHVDGVLLHLEEDLFHGGRFGTKNGLRRTDLRSEFFPVDEEGNDVLGVEEPLDVVHPAPEDGIARESGRADGLQDLVRAGRRPRWP